MNVGELREILMASDHTVVSVYDIEIGERYSVFDVVASGETLRLMSGMQLNDEVVALSKTDILSLTSSIPTDRKVGISTPTAEHIDLWYYDCVNDYIDINYNHELDTTDVPEINSRTFIKKLSALCKDRFPSVTAICDDYLITNSMDPSLLDRTK